MISSKNFFRERLAALGLACLLSALPAAAAERPFAEAYAADIEGAFRDVELLRPFNAKLAERVSALRKSKDKDVRIMSSGELLALVKEAGAEMTPGWYPGEGQTIHLPKEEGRKAVILIGINLEAGTATFAPRRLIFHELLHAADPDHGLVQSSKLHRYATPDVVYACMFVVYGIATGDDSNRSINRYENNIGAKIPPDKELACEGRRLMRRATPELPELWQYPDECRREKYITACRGSREGARCYGCK